LKYEKDVLAANSCNEARGLKAMYGSEQTAAMKLEA
jgi:hypothetical protein